MKSRLIFDHIPKTAGTSISAALEQMFGESPGLAEFFNAHFHVLRFAGTRRILGGHLWFTPGERLDPHWYYCTLLRDPLDRFLSQYWFYKAVGRQHALESGNQPHPDPQVQAATDLDLGQFLDTLDPAIRPAFCDVQAIHYARRVSHTPAALSPGSLLTAAISSLEQYDLIGIFDDTQGFVDAIADEMGYPRVEIPRLNVTHDRRHQRETGEHLLAKLREVNQVDIELYAWARERFAQRKSLLASPEGERLRAERAQERKDLDSQPATPAPAPPDSVDFGTREAEVLSVRCIGSRDAPEIASGEPVAIAIDFEARWALPDLTVGIAIRDVRGQLMYGMNSHLLGVSLSVPAAGRYRLRLAVGAPLGPGEYAITIALHRGPTHEDGCYHWVENAARLRIVGFASQAFHGLVDLEMRVASEVPEPI